MLQQHHHNIVHPLTVTNCLVIRGIRLQDIKKQVITRFNTFGEILATRASSGYIFFNFVIELRIKLWQKLFVNARWIRLSRDLNLTNHLPYLPSQRLHFHFIKTSYNTLFKSVFAEVCYLQLKILLVFSCEIMLEDSDPLVVRIDTFL